MAQSIEVHVGAAVDRHQVFAAYAGALHVTLHAGDGKRTGGVGEGASVVEDVFDGGAELVGADQHDRVDALARHSERLGTDPAHGHAGGEDADLIQYHPLLALQRALQGGLIFGLDADHLHLGIERFDIGRYAGDQAAAAYRHEDGVLRRLVLAQYLHRHRALSRDHLRVVVGMNEHHAFFVGETHGAAIRLIIGVAVQHGLAAQLAHRLHLDVRRGARHDDERLDAEAAGGERHALCMIAGGGGDYALGALRCAQVDDLVIGAAQLEGDHRLQIFAFQQHVVVETRGQGAHHIERCFDRDVVHTRLQDFFEVFRWHPNTVTASLGCCLAAARHDFAYQDAYHPPHSQAGESTCHRTHSKRRWRKRHCVTCRPAPSSASAPGPPPISLSTRWRRSSTRSTARWRAQWPRRNDSGNTAYRCWTSTASTSLRCTSMAPTRPQKTCISSRAAAARSPARRSWRRWPGSLSASPTNPSLWTYSAAFRCRSK